MSYPQTRATTRQRRLRTFTRLGVDPFIAPEKTRHGRITPPAPRGRIPRDLSARDRMRRKLRTKRGRERYALRMGTVEPVFGQVKQCRGFRQFLLRGLDKVNGEWLLICMGHNLLKLFRSEARSAARAWLKRSAASASNPSEVMSGTMFEKQSGRLTLRAAKIVVAVHCLGPYAIINHLYSDRLLGRLLSRLQLHLLYALSSVQIG